MIDKKENIKKEKTMCKFFSFLMDENEKMYYLNHEVRHDIMDKKLNLYPDSHSSIAEYYKINEDKCNKYEFNPITGSLVLDKKNIPGTKCAVIPKDELLFMVDQAVPELIIKPAINPFADCVFDGKVTDNILQLLKSWKDINSMICEIDERPESENKVADAVYCSVRDSVDGRMFAFIEGFVRLPIWNEIRTLIRNFLNLSIYDDDWNQVNNSLWDIMYVYISSFFNLPKWVTGNGKSVSEGNNNNPFQAGIDLWEMGLIPCYDGKKWYLYSGKGFVYKEE